MPMTNAERQKRHRDKGRGGPPAGGGPPGYLSVGKRAKALDVGRTLMFMSQWILQHAPDVADRIESGELRTTPTYTRLRNEYVMCVARALEARRDDGDARLEVFRRNGEFF